MDWVALEAPVGLRDCEPDDVSGDYYHYWLGTDKSR